MNGARHAQTDSLLPTVSIVMVVRNDAGSVAAAIDSVLEQGYPSLQFVIQDGGSTDSTLGIVESYGSAVDFVSEPESGGDGLGRGLIRATGEVIGFCRADGAMAAGAIDRAVRQLSSTPDIGAVTGDSLRCDGDGRVIGVDAGRPFDLLSYLLGEQTPDLAASFFRRRALDDIGFFTERWETAGLNALDFELWCRLGIEHRVAYAPHPFARRLAARESMRDPAAAAERLCGRLTICERHLFGPGTFFGNDRPLRDYIVHCQQQLYAGLPNEPTDDDLAFRAGLAHTVAMLYRDRGQVDEALAAGERTAALNDETIEAMYVQLALASPSITDRELQRRQTRWAAKYADPVRIDPGSTPADQQSSSEPAANGMLTVGYNSSFWNIQTGQAILNPVIAAHDRARIRVVGYCCMEQPRSVKDLFDEFHVTGSMSHGEFCRLARSHRLDVLVETNGLSFGGRLPAMAGRCAPVQISYVNHLGTTAVPNVDYVITDRGIVGGLDQTCYSERLYPLERCFLAYTYRDMWAPPVSPPPFEKNGYITFGSFGGPYKLNLECLRLWASVLERVPGARLLLQNPGMDKPGNVAFIRERFRALRIDADRLIVLPGTDRRTILEHYQMMDICLDSWPYCGGNTTAEALWQGVPVVTLKGDRFVSAYGASLNLAAGMGDLIAGSREDFSAIASTLAQDRQRLAELRTTLRERMVSGGLSDPKAMATALEDAYFDMVSRPRGC